MIPPSLNLLVHLKQAHVGFVIIGGFAAAIHGCTLVTQDIDICMDFSAENLLRLQEALRDLNPVHRMTPQRVKLHLTAADGDRLQNLYLDTDLGPLDCLSQVKGLGSYEQVVHESQEIETDGYTLCVLRVAALIKAKEALNRPQDQLAVAQLQAIQHLANADIEKKD